MKRDERNRQLVREFACLACGRVGTACFAHYPRHRGMGGGMAGDGLLEGIPLCSGAGECHDRFDGKNCRPDEALRARVRETAPAYFAAILHAYSLTHYLGPESRVREVRDGRV